MLKKTEQRFFRPFGTVSIAMSCTHPNASVVSCPSAMLKDSTDIEQIAAGLSFPDHLAFIYLAACRGYFNGAAQLDAVSLSTQAH
jgi:hypothetical protein